MNKITSAKFIKLVLALAAMLVITAGVCFAETEERIEFFKLEYINDEINFDSDLGKKDQYAKLVKEEFVFLDENTPAFTEGADKNTGVHTEVYAHKFELAKEELLVGICKAYNKEEENSVKISIRTAEALNPAELTIVTESGESVGFDSFTTMELTARTVSLQLNEEQLNLLSYYKEPNHRYYILKITTDNDRMAVTTVSVEQDRNGLGVARAMNAPTNYYDSIADYTQLSYCHASDAVSVLQLNGETVSVLSTDFSEMTDMHLVENYSLIAKTTAEATAEEIELINAYKLENQSVTADDTDDAIDIAIDLIEEDIPEQEYISVDEGSSSTVYADSYLYTENKNSNRFYQKAGTLGLDFYLNIYGIRGYVSMDLPTYMEEELQLGATFDASALPVNSILLTVSDVTETGYAGKMNLRLEGETAAITKKVVFVATPSDAQRPETEEEDTNQETTKDNSDGNTMEAGTAETDNTGSETTEIDNTATDITETGNTEAEVPVSRQLVYETTNAAQNIGTREVLFYKAGAGPFSAHTGETTLTEAFLKKASYCAVDSSGIICAVYNEHGRLVQLAEGYTEEDISAYILLPYAELENGEQEDLCISELTITYNDVLAQEGNYALVSYKDESGNNAATDLTVSTYVGMEEYLDLQIDNDALNKVFYLTADGMTAELQADVLTDYTIQANMESETGMEEVIVEGSEISESAEDEICPLDEEEEAIDGSNQMTDENADSLSPDAEGSADIVTENAESGDTVSEDEESTDTESKSGESSDAESENTELPDDESENGESSDAGSKNEESNDIDTENTAENDINAEETKEDSSENENTDSTVTETNEEMENCSGDTNEDSPGDTVAEPPDTGPGDTEVEAPDTGPSETVVETPDTGPGDIESETPEVSPSDTDSEAMQNSTDGNCAS